MSILVHIRKTLLSHVILRLIHIRVGRDHKDGKTLSIAIGGLIRETSTISSIY